MAKFIDLRVYNPVTGEEGTRWINVDAIKELSTHTLGHKTITRVHLGNNESFDVLESLLHVKTNIEAT